MNEDEKRRIGVCAQNVNHSCAASIENGDFDYLLEIDFDEVVREFNNGNVDTLKSASIQKFIDSTITAKSLAIAIVRAKALLSCKSNFFSEVERRKDGMVYNSKEQYCRLRYYPYDEYTYEEMEKMFTMTERFLSSKTYAILRILLKYESLRSQLSERKELFETLDSNGEKTEVLRSVLNSSDTNVGVIKIVEDGEIRVRIGTKQDIVISDLIGMPYPADCDKPGYHYGSHDDFYQPPHKVTKEFIENGVTPNHSKLIEKEKSYRIKLRKHFTRSVTGYILSNGCAIIIKNTDLLKNGIDPKRVGWKPLKLTVEPQDLNQIFKSSDETRYLSMASITQIQANMISSKRKH